MDIRQHSLQELTTVPAITAVVTNVFPGMRPSRSALPAIVYRCAAFQRGEVNDDDDGTRMARMEFEVWAETLDGCITIKDVLVARYHGQGDGYNFGGLA